MKMNSTSQITDALKKHYDKWGYVFLKNVEAGVGCNSRYADAIAMTLFKSRGLNIIGFEIKASRQDWINELKNPEKADVIYDLCDAWVLVTGDPSIVKNGELPNTWGLMTAKNEKTLITVKEPVFKEYTKFVDKRFLSAILVRVCQQAIPEAKIKELLDKAHNEGYEKRKQQDKEFVDRAIKERDDSLNKIRSFEKASGVELDSWKHSPSAVGNVVHAVLNNVYTNELNRLKSLKNDADRISKDIDDILNGKF